jgi:acetolactate synthase-1/2/3 large subunit
MLSVAECVVEQLIQAGVRHVFGVGGANIEDMFAAIQRRRPAIRAILTKHEHGAGSAAAAYARVSGKLGVVLATSGGGALNLVHAIAEARASQLPVLAIVGEPPSDLQGLGAFQDTSGRGGAVDAASVFKAVASWCVRANSAAEIPRLLDQALDHIARDAGSAVLLIAKDRQCAALEATQRTRPQTGQPPAAPPTAALYRAAAERLQARRCVILAGEQVARAGAQAELEALASALDAAVAVAPDARDAFDNRHARFIGVAGAMGHVSVAQALSQADACLVVGTRLPLLTRMGLEADLSRVALVSIGREPLFVSGSGAVQLSVEPAAGMRGLQNALLESSGATSTPRAWMDAPQVHAPSAAFDLAGVLTRLEAHFDTDSVVIADAGNSGASAVHYLRAPRGGKWLLAMGMAGMGYGFGASIGAAFASGGRCWVIAGDGAFYMHGFELHTAIEHRLPITYVILNNRAHGMCLVRERLLLHDNAGYNAFGPAHLGAGLAAMFPGLTARDCKTLEELDDACRACTASAGPSVIAIELDEVEVPPFVAFQRADPSARRVPRGDNP